MSLSCVSGTGLSPHSRPAATRFVTVCICICTSLTGVIQSIVGIERAVWGHRFNLHVLHVLHGSVTVQCRLRKTNTCRCSPCKPILYLSPSASRAAGAFFDCDVRLSACITVPHASLHFTVLFFPLTPTCTYCIAPQYTVYVYTCPSGISPTIMAVKSQSNIRLSDSVSQGMRRPFCTVTSCLVPHAQFRTSSGGNGNLKWHVTSLTHDPPFRVSRRCGGGAPALEFSPSPSINVAGACSRSCGRSCALLVLSLFPFYR